MNALVLTERKSPLVYRQVPDIAAEAGMVIVNLKRAALNRRDYWITQGLYPGVKTPCILGSDGAGTTPDGREVIINPGVLWGDNPRAQTPDFHILGMPMNGTFAQAVAVPAAQLHDKPAHLNWDQAAALPLAGVTAYRALFTQGGLKSGQTLLITGVGGGVAATALQFAVAAGARVAVTSSSPDKIAEAKKLGALAGYNYRDADWTAALGREIGPVDLVLDSAGGPAYNALLGVLRPGGAVVNYGSTAGAPKDLDLFKVFWNQLRILGSTMGSPADFAEMLALVNRHRIVPVVDRVAPLAEGSELVAFMARMEQFGKLVLDVD